MVTISVNRSILTSLCRPLRPILVPLRAAAQFLSKKPSPSTDTPPPRLRYRRFDPPTLARQHSSPEELFNLYVPLQDHSPPEDFAGDLDYALANISHGLNGPDCVFRKIENPDVKWLKTRRAVVPGRPAEDQENRAPTRRLADID